MKRTLILTALLLGGWISVVAEPKTLSVVLGSEGPLGQSQTVGLESVLRLDPDRLLAPVFVALGKGADTKAVSYGGWESRQIAGHSLGHYLSALAGFWADTKDPRVKAKLDYTVSVLKKVQRSDGYVGGVSSEPFDQAFRGDFDVDNFALAGYWVPWYSIHKIYAGLVDAFVFGGNTDALAVVRRMADWAVKGTSKMTDAQFQRMLVCEHGGMCKVMADLYGLTGEKKYLVLAERFVHHAVMDPLMAGRDELQGLHANTQIPKVIGLARLYELTGKAQYRRGAETFFRTVTDQRSYVIGGNSISEHFGPAGSEPLGRDTCETCNTYNMMELAEHLAAWTHDSRYADYYETAQLNHILGSQDPATGAKTYFVSLDPGHFKVYGTEEDAFWCCTGTGMENPERYNRFIASRDGDSLFLNLFASSSLVTDDLSLKITTDYPVGTKVTIDVVSAGPSSPRLKIRRPRWLTGPLVATLGQQSFRRDDPGYLTVDANLKTGDRLELALPMELREIPAKDDPHHVAVAYGPLVLAAALGTERFPETDIVGDHLSLMTWPGVGVPPVITDGPVTSWVTERDPQKLTFQTAAGVMGPGVVTLVPFYALQHQRYTVYFDRYRTNETAALAERTQTRDQRYAPVTRDVVRVGQQQSELDHGFRSSHSFRGYLASVDLNWRDARGANAWFAYQMQFHRDGHDALQVTYYGKDGPIPNAARHFRILVGGRPLAEVELRGNGLDKAVDVRYPVPTELLADASTVAGVVNAEVRFETLGSGTFAGGVLEVRVVDISR